MRLFLSVILSLIVAAFFVIPALAADEAKGVNYAYGVAIDNQGNVIVTGASTIWHDYNENGTYDKEGEEGEINPDYCTIKYDPGGNELWRQTYDSGDRDEANAVAVDSENNIIVTGRSADDYYTIKYDPDGNELWHAAYEGEGADYADGVAVDSDDNIIVTGFSHDGASNNYYTIKYNKDGDKLWSKVYDSLSELTGESVGTGDGSKTDFTLKPSPIVIVPGSETIYLNDIETTAYSIDYTTGGITFTSAPGNDIVITADYTGYDSNCAQEVAIDSEGNIIVSGSSVGLEEGAKWYACTIKYGKDGNELWDEPVTYHGVYKGEPWSITAYGAAVDSEDNIVITGSYYTPYSFEDNIFHPPIYNCYITIKYNADGIEVWGEPVIYEGEYEGENAYDCAYDVTVDKENNIIVTGCSGGDYCTIKYDKDGNKIWSEPVTYDGGNWDAALDVAVDSAGNVIVTGNSQGGEEGEPNYDYCTIKYDSNGKEDWVVTYGSGENDGGGLPGAAIAGIAVGGCAVLGGLGYYGVRQRQNRPVPRAKRRRELTEKRKKLKH